MSALARVRQVVRRTGFDVNRYPMNEPGFQRAELLRRQEVSFVFDVGANRGQYVQELRRFGYRGRVASFEPTGEAFSHLRAAAASDGAWTAMRYALGDEDAKVTINVAANNAASSSVLPMLATHRDAAPDATYVSSEEVGQHRLDGIWQEFASPEDRIFLKIDVQGYERQVLDGAAGMLDRVAGVQLEVSFAPLYEGGMLYQEAFRLMDELGMVPMTIHPNFTDPATGRLLQCDVTFFRKDSLRTVHPAS